MLQSTPLWYLIQVGNCQSVSIAAEKLHISQPSLSIAIKKLEDELGLKLLERTYRGVCLTEDGKKVVELANKAFSYFNEIEQLSENKKQQAIYQKDIFIYTNPALIHCLTSSFHHINSNINIEIITLDTSVDIKQLIIKNPNVIVLAILNESFTLPENMGFSVLTKSKSYIMCSSDFPYIPKERTSISFKELTQIPLAILSSSFEFQDTLLCMLRKHGTPNIKTTVNDIFVLSNMTKNGSCAMFGNKLMPTNPDEHSRYVAIQNAPNFVTGLIYNKSISQDTIQLLSNHIKPHLI